MKYLLGFFYRNTLDYLKLAIQSVGAFREHIVVIDNTPNLSLRSEPDFPKDIPIIEPPFPLSFTQSMNYLIQLAGERDCDVVMFMHNDVEAHPNTPERFLKTVEHLLHDGSKWGIATTSDYLSLFAQNMKMVREIGLWDTVFPDMYSDSDYLYRAHIAGYEFIDTELPITHHNGGSNTIKSDFKLWNLTALYAPLWLEYYKSKWGGELLGENYSVPYLSSSKLSNPTHWLFTLRKFQI